jgi:selenocysteine-specific elongation factor
MRIIAEAPTRAAADQKIEQVRAVVERLVASEGSVTLARLRDELALSRRYAQALLEHLDAARVTRRLPDDSRVLRRRAPRLGASGRG